MRRLLSLLAAAVLLGSAPAWLPRAVVGLRARVFTRINGEEGIQIPGPLVDVDHFKDVYAHPAANGRSRGAALSDLFWYWLAPGPEIHQEHVEPGERYNEIARATRRFLAIPRERAESGSYRCAERVLRELDIRGTRVVRLRDLMMPVWAEFYYELVFGEPCTPTARRLIVDNATDVATALKCSSLRHMDRRHRLTRFLMQKIESDQVAHPMPEHLTTEERALYLQGVFFNTAIVQTSEAMAHLFMAIAQNPDVQDRLRSEGADDYLDLVIAEAFRLYPLFGISHRITSGDIVVDQKTTIPAGSVLCFNHLNYHRAGYDRTEQFLPDRWRGLSPHEANYIPFGVAGNRPCPAQALAPATMRGAAKALLAHFALFSSAAHTRSIPNRGPCLLVSSTETCTPVERQALLLGMFVRDQWEEVGRSLLQLALGTYMVWDARRLRLCERYFSARPNERVSQ
jgi:hypothetical protein